MLFYPSTPVWRTLDRSKRLCLSWLKWIGQHPRPTIPELEALEPIASGAGIPWGRQDLHPSTWLGMTKDPAGFTRGFGSIQGVDADGTIGDVIADVNGKPSTAWTS